MNGNRIFSFLLMAFLLSGCFGSQPKGNSGGNGAASNGDAGPSGNSGGGGPGPNGARRSNRGPASVGQNTGGVTTGSGGDGGLSGGPAAFFPQSPGSIAGGSSGGVENGEPNVGDMGPSHYKPSDVTPDIKGLNKSGEGGNPSFSFSVVGYRQGRAIPMPECQATLTKKGAVAGVVTCSVVTAAHCLTEAEDVDDPRPRPSRFGADITEPDKKTSKQVSLSAPDFGPIKALAILNPVYVASTNLLDVQRTSAGTQINVSPGKQDVALLVFQGEACEKTPAKVVPMEAACASSTVKVTSRWKRTTFPASVQTSGSDRVAVKIDGDGIKQGDSGGALVCGAADNERVMGVLSTGGDSRLIKADGFSENATYSANEAIQWAMQSEGAIFENKGLIGKVPKNPGDKPKDPGLLVSRAGGAGKGEFASTHSD